MVHGEVDWISALLQTLDSSPLILTDTFHKRALRSNSWQCHILACMVTCLAPRLRAEIVDFRVCSSYGELEQEARASVQVASQEVCHALRQAESFVQACRMEDAVSLIVSTACTGEALTVHVHNFFWCVSGLFLATRVAFGFSDDKLSALIEQQVNCWSHIISRYIGLGAELLDHKDLASARDGNISCHLDSKLQGLFGESHVEMPSVARLLSCRLQWVLCKDRMRENQVDTLLADLKIDSKELEFENTGALDEANRERQPFARASWAGIPVSVKWCRLSHLRDHASMLLRMRNPFILQLIGWTEVADDKGLSCYMVMEDVHTDLEGFIKAKVESKAANQEQVLLFPFSLALNMMLQVARGMWYLHRNGIAHRSLRSRKVLVCTKDRDGPGLLKLCHAGLPSFVQSTIPSDFAADVFSFAMLCREMLTGKIASTSTDRAAEMDLPVSIPVLLSDCLKACGDSKPQNRPEFGVICGLLRHLKLIVANPDHLERLLYLNEAAKASSKPPNTDSVSPPIKGTGKGTPDDMNIRVQLIDINVHLLHTSTPLDMYPLVAAESWIAKPPISLNTLVDISTQFIQNLSNSQESSSSSIQPKFVIASTGTLKTSVVFDGCQGLLKSGWVHTTLGLGTLEMWLQHMSPDWKDIQKVALGVALCLRHISKTPPKIGFYSQEQGVIDGFYPIYPRNFILNNQLKVALLLDNSLPAWNGLTQWAGVHPQVGEGVDNILISIEAYTTFYFGHFLSSIIKVRLSKIDRTTASLLDQHCEFVLTNLAMRCIQLKYLSMAEVVTILLNDNKPFQNH